FASYRELECFIRAQLRCDRPAVVRDGLSNVLYWGYATSPGRQRSRVEKFRQEVASEQIRNFMTVVRGTPGLRAIKECRLPQFSGEIANLLRGNFLPELFDTRPLS